MQASDFIPEARPRLVPTERGSLAFVPAPLPPRLNLTHQLVTTLSAADRAVGRLAGVGAGLPNPHLLIRPFLRREAVLSSQIEGTVASLSDLLLFEANPAVEADVPDVREVHNYVRALEFGLDQLKRRPLTLNLIRELHDLLMEGVRGQDRGRGRFRTVQHWIGAGNCPIERARYVPPPPMQHLDACLDAFEKYVNTPDDLPGLLRLALIHYQFEAIHPFVDGNGRIGRLLITLLLCRYDLLPQPLLYLSAHFEGRRREYYDHLLNVSTRGSWGEWAAFFLEGVREQAEDALTRTTALMNLRDRFRHTVQESGAPARLLQLVDHLFASPVIKVADVHRALPVNPRTALAYVDKLVEVGVLTEVTGRKRDRLFAARAVIEAVQRRTTTGTA